jgi:hypothetical protein
VYYNAPGGISLTSLPEPPNFNPFENQEASPRAAREMANFRLAWLNGTWYLIAEVRVTAEPAEARLKPGAE